MVIVEALVPSAATLARLAVRVEYAVVAMPDRKSKILDLIKFISTVSSTLEPPKRTVLQHYQQ
jgi:hypothetical protein